MDPKNAPLHLSLLRPILVAGVEPRIVVLEGTLVATLLLGVGLHTFTVLCALLIALGVHPLLARLSKSDPHALAVYARAVRYQAAYPRAAHPSCPAAVYRAFDEGF
ncbi:MAG TPA: VirB3 family type IV secretion system protein [Thermoanaerobaculia bacterium]|nr:VirB3 family type IV secretion system protein [Thermoanaerobaculia bacterium]